MSLYTARVQRDSVNGGTYNFREKAACVWGSALDNTNAINFSEGSRYFKDFESIADAPAVGTATGEMSVKDLESNATSEACVKVKPATTTAERAQHGWVRASAVTAADLRGIQVNFPEIGDLTLKASKNTAVEFSVNLRKGSSWFVGCGESAAAIMTDSITMANKDFIGFRRLEASSVAGPLVFVTHKTGVTEQTATILTAAQLAAMATAGVGTSTSTGAEIDLPINLGFSVNSGGLVSISVNGVNYPAAVTTINTAHASTACLPTLMMTRTICVGRSSNATDGDENPVAIEIDWIESFNPAA